MRRKPCQLSSMSFTRMSSILRHAALAEAPQAAKHFHASDLYSHQSQPNPYEILLRCSLCSPQSSPDMLSCHFAQHNRASCLPLES